jgi:hypothetical protein
VTLDVVTGELLPASTRRTDLLEAAPVDDVAALQQQFYDLCIRLLVDDDFQPIGGKRYKTKSAWRKLAAAFNVSDELVERIYDRDPDTDRVTRAEFVVKATAPNGRSTIGIGIASKYERSFSNPEHDIPATAHTRAKNRAFSDLFGLGEVSAEEMTDRTDNAGSTGTSGRGGSRRRRVDKPSDTASSPSPEPETPPPPTIPGADAMGERLAASPDAVRLTFRDWRRSKGWPWPPTSPEMLADMTVEVDRITAEHERDSDGYDEIPF